jgi:hypothetical protein
VAALKVAAVSTQNRGLEATRTASRPSEVRKSSQDASLEPEQPFEAPFPWVAELSPEGRAFWRSLWKETCVSFDRDSSRWAWKSYTESMERKIAAPS